MNWPAPKRPVDHAEENLIRAILQGEFPPQSPLPAERTLAERLGVTRPTLREALRRLERDGWLTVHQGKQTIVRDFWWQGGLNVLSGIVRFSKELPPDFVPNLLSVRRDLAPSYTRAAVEKSPDTVREILSKSQGLEDGPVAYAAFDWALQHHLTVASGNPVYALILNSFEGFYEPLARLYFSVDASRQSSSGYYQILLRAVDSGDGELAERETRIIMQESITLWTQVAHLIDLAVLAEGGGAS